MSAPRLHPVEHVFGSIVEERFPAISQAMGEETSLERFLLVEPALTLLQDLRPDDGLGETAQEFVAFVHAVWLWWASGAITRPLDATATTALLESGPITTAGGPAVCYIQVDPRRLWARLDDATVHEPIDGWFVMPEGSGRRVVACLGLHGARPGLSVLLAEGERPIDWRRPDGSPTFSPRMDGGNTAGLASVDSREELLLLAWNVPDT